MHNTISAPEQEQTNSSTVRKAKPYLILIECQGQIVAFETKAEYQEYLTTRDTELCRY
ncbi:hypothetical protein WBG78_15775 [Chryseolinea sp. T2]|uniref:hypothetical protein n=1 Tax=Chryseolinea sp. T2 TaxID=3129255 RepID=UPI00307818EF